MCNERLLMLDRALVLIGMFSNGDFTTQLNKIEEQAYHNVLRYVAKEFARGWRSEEELFPKIPNIDVPGLPSILEQFNEQNGLESEEGESLGGSTSE